MHSFVGGFRAPKRSTARRTAVVASSHVGRGGHQGARILGQGAHVIAVCVFMFVHIFLPFYLFVVFNDEFSASAGWDASGKLATFRTEFLPPNGLGTDSLASGSGIHWPSTTRQYS